MDFRRLFDIFPYQQVRYPNKTALAHKQGIRWEAFSTAACLAEIDRVSAGLLDLGLKPGDKMGIMTHHGSPYWNFLDFGMQQIGVVPVPIHATVTDRELVYILKDADIQHCIVADRELFERVKQAKTEAVQLKEIFTLKPLPDVRHWRELSIEPMPKHLADLTGLKAAIHEDDLATIVYTAGTTGDPKGVLLSHKNIVSNIKAMIELIPLNFSKRTMSFLPLSHIFERTFTYTYMVAGTSLYYTDHLESILENTQEIKPHYFTSAPLFLKKMYDDILLRTKDMSRPRRAIVQWAIRVGERYMERNTISIAYWLQLHLADLLVYRAWRRALGRRVEGIIVGIGALQARLARLFSAAGIEIRECYSLTETSSVVTFNRFESGGVRFGTAGPPIPDVEIRIEPLYTHREEGEILVKGPNVMLGYHDDEQATQAAWAEDGWLHTGDVGKLDQDHFLTITGRRENIFQTPRGRYVAPKWLEALLDASPYVEQSMVVGHHRPYVTALIVPHFEALEQWAEQQGIHWTAPQFMVSNSKIRQLFNHIIEVFNEQVSSHERIRQFHLLSEPWSIEKGEQTPALTLRRQVILAKYESKIETLYASKLV